jgi:hypothetical protein
MTEPYLTLQNVGSWKELFPDRVLTVEAQGKCRWWIDQGARSRGSDFTQGPIVVIESFQPSAFEFKGLDSCGSTGLLDVRVLTGTCPD